MTSPPLRQSPQKAKLGLEKLEARKLLQPQKLASQTSNVWNAFSLMRVPGLDAAS